MASEIKVDTVSEKTAANGITLDGLNIKDAKLTTANSVVEANMSANSVDSDSYVDGSIDTAHIADLNVTTGKIAADAITGAKIADDAINSEHYTDGSIDHVHLASGVGFRPNAYPIIINGNMAVAQRSASVTGVDATGYHSIDRYKFSDDSDAVLTFTQESLTSGNANLDGFANAFKIDVTTVDSSLGADQHALLSTAIEGQDLQVFKKGTANAETITIAFWVKATKTGTSIFEIYDNDNTRQVSKAFTISTTNTWEKKVLNIPADTSGALDDDNAASLFFQWYLCAGANYQSGTLSQTWTSPTTANRAVGQVNHFDNTSNNFHITGIQVEVGTYTAATIPPFQHESFGDNLSRCQRYLEIRGAADNNLLANGQAVITTRGMMFLLCSPKRAVPSVTLPTAILLTAANASAGAVTSSGVNTFTNTGGRFDCNIGSANLVVGNATGVQPSGDSTGLRFDAEL